jgi:hypothetical protein
MIRLKKSLALPWICLVGIIIPSMAMGGSEPADKSIPIEPARSVTEKAARPVVVYSPPLRGMPVNRIGAATRSASGSALPTVMALVPEHTGLTIHDQPVLFWYLFEPAACPVELSIIDESQYEPLWQSRISQPVQSGFHRIRLTDSGLKLDKGKSYKWFVALVLDSDHRSKDVIAGGVIERINPSESLNKKLSRSDPLQRVAIFAEEGIWYDTLTAISDLVDAQPGNSSLENTRMDLLTQVGLDLRSKGK